MKISARTLIALSDPACEPKFRKYLEKRIRTREDQEEAKQFFHRVHKIVGIPLRSPEVIDGSEELDPNCVAEYLDHKLSAEDEKHFESLFLSSDIFLAELADVSSILNPSLGHATEIPDEIRARLYEIGCKIPEPASATKPPVPFATQPAQMAEKNKVCEEYARQKNLQESLEDWKWERLNHIKNIVVLLIFIAIGFFVWNNQDTINQRTQKKREQEKIGNTSDSLSEATIPTPSVLESVEWDDREGDLPFYTKMESPESILKKTGPKPRSIFQTNEILPAAL